MTIELVRAQELSARAEADPSYSLYCVFPIDGKPHKLFYLEDTEARVPGHVYSYMGRKEVGITGMCEWCFDEVTKEPEEEDDPFYREVPKEFIDRVIGEE